MSINLNNYEEWMVAYIDGELGKDDLEMFQEFLDANPDLQSELEAFESVKFETEEAVIFEQKETLYKKAGALVFLKKAWPIAAAIILGIAIWPFINNETEEVPVVAQEKKIETKKTGEAEVEIEEVEQVERDILPKSKQIAPTPVIAQLPQAQPVKQVSTPTIVRRKQKNSVRQVRKIIREEYVDAPKVPTQKKVIEKIPEPKILEQPLKEVVLVQEKPKSNPKPKAILPPLPMELEEQEKALLVINEDTHPLLYEKLNTAVDKVETKLKTIQELKEEPITVCIGKLKLFTINN